MKHEALGPSPWDLPQLVLVIEFRASRVIPVD
jgi:hypothetical protein